MSGKVKSLKLYSNTKTVTVKLMSSEVTHEYFGNTQGIPYLQEGTFPKCTPEFPVWLQCIASCIVFHTHTHASTDSL